MNLTKILLLLTVIAASSGLKVLLVFPQPVRSLNLLGQGFVRHLIEAGHEVTFVTAYPMKPEKNFEQIDVSQILDILSDVDKMVNMTAIMTGEMQLNIQQLQEYAMFFAKAAFENENLLKFLHDPQQHFDVVLIDLYETDVYSGLAALYDCPLIWSYSMGAHWNVLRLIDQPTNPAYSVDYLSSNVVPLNFIQRLQELWAQINWNIIKRLYTEPEEKALYEETFSKLFQLRGRTMPDYEDLVYNASLIFSNEHPSFGNIPSTPQNFVFVGGQHIKTPPNPLPKDLQSLMDNAEHGVIYFSLGSTWKSTSIPKFITEEILRVFGGLKQTVIWKFEAELTNLPKNVHITSWAPQHSILAHPKCLIFITHGGLLSSTEAVHYGVPIIGVPISFDQFINIHKAVSKGYALKADFTLKLAENMKEAIQIMLNDDKYRKRVKELSQIYHDRVVPPGAEIVHWVEHVARTRGAAHLRSPARLVPWYQKLFLDLITLVLAAILVLRYALKNICCVNKKKVDKEKKTK